MQKFFVFVALSLFALSCGNIEKHREAITSLTTDWETTTQQVTEFANELAKETTDWQSMYDGMFTKVNVSETISGDAMTEMNNLKQTYQENGTTYKTMQEEVANFVKAWEEKTADVTALKEGLESGTLSAESIEKISTLRESIDGVPTSLEAWKKNLQETKDNCQAVYQRYTELTTEKDS